MSIDCNSKLNWMHDTIKEICIANEIGTGNEDETKRKLKRITLSLVTLVTLS